MYLYSNITKPSQMEYESTKYCNEYDDDTGKIIDPITYEPIPTNMLLEVTSGTSGTRGTSGASGTCGTSGTSGASGTSGNVTRCYNIDTIARAVSSSGSFTDPFTRIPFSTAVCNKVQAYIDNAYTYINLGDDIPGVRKQIKIPLYTTYDQLPQLIFKEHFELVGEYDILLGRGWRHTSIYDLQLSNTFVGDREHGVADIMIRPFESVTQRLRALIKLEHYIDTNVYTNIMREEDLSVNIVPRYLRYLAIKKLITRSNWQTLGTASNTYTLQRTPITLNKQ